MFGSPNSFIKGAKVRIAEAFNCAECELVLSQPIPENENIIDLYDSLPQNFDSYSGIKDMSAEGVRFVFEVYGIHKDLWDDYYNRLMIFHRAFLDARERREKKKQKIQESMEKARQGRTREPQPGKAGNRG